MFALYLALSLPFDGEAMRTMRWRRKRRRKSRQWANESGYSYRPEICRLPKCRWSTLTLL